MSYTIQTFTACEEPTADLAKYWNDDTSGQVAQTSTGRFGNGTFFGETGGDGWVSRLYNPGYTEFVIGAGINIEAVGSGPPTLFSAYEGASTQHINLRYSTTEPIDLLVYRGTTLMATLDTNLSNDTWYHIQFAARINDTTGYYYVYVNDVEVGSATSQDTRNAGTTGTADRFKVGFVNAVTGTPIFRMDDFYFATVTSGPEHPGDLRAARLLPTGAGASTQFTPSAGSNFQNVDETTVDDDTTYNESSGSGNIDTFAMADMANSPTTIYAIKQMYRARKTDAGPRTLRSILRSGSTNYEGSDQTMSTSYVSFEECRTVDPDTSSAWTESGVNAMQLGYKVQA